MRLLFSFLLSALLLNYNARSQDVSLNFKYANIDTILKEIKKQTNLDYLLGDRKIDSMSIYVIEWSLLEALSILLDGRPYTFAIYSKYFSIIDKIPGAPEKKKDVGDEGKYIQGPPPADVTGKLVDKDGKPIAGAYIQMLQSNVITTSDQNGNFLLKKVNVEGGFEITHTDYETKRYFMIGEINLKPIQLQGKKWEFVINIDFPGG